MRHSLRIFRLTRREGRHLYHTDWNAFSTKSQEGASGRHMSFLPSSVGVTYQLALHIALWFRNLALCAGAAGAGLVLDPGAENAEQPLAGSVCLVG